MKPLNYINALTALLGLAVPATADSTTTINPKTSWGTWEGWGTSLAWWAAAFGTRDDLADLFFTTKSVSYNGASVPGLGLNIVRYNAGACSFNSYNGEAMVQSPKIIKSRQIAGYWINWASNDSASSSWDWSVDANQRTMLQKAVSRGADQLELFSNSPMWWMCLNHNPSGSNDGSSDNLQSWNYEAHAVYLANIAQYAQAHWGLTFDSVEAFNEPSSNWWNGQSGTQEGCHIGASVQVPVLNYLRSALNARGLSSTTIAASDETSYDLAVSTWNSLVSSGASGNVGRINVHGYQYGSGNRAGLYTASRSAGKKLWNSEYGENDGTGAQLAANLLLDMRNLHPTAWVYWQMIDGGGWGMLVGDNDAKTLGAVNQKHYVLAQFSRRIRPGMLIVDGGSANTVAAYDATNKKPIIVAVNTGAAQTITFNLSGFTTGGTNGAVVPRWSSAIGSSGDKYVSHSDTTISGKTFKAAFATSQVQTFEISNVSI